MASPRKDSDPVLVFNNGSRPNSVAYQVAPSKAEHLPPTLSEKITVPGGNLVPAFLAPQYADHPEMLSPEESAHEWASESRAVAQIGRSVSMPFLRFACSDQRASVKAAAEARRQHLAG